VKIALIPADRHNGSVLVRHLTRVFKDLFTYSAVTRRPSLAVTIVLAVALVALAIVGKAAAPFVVYPLL
jgi:hypothetical protein